MTASVVEPPQLVENLKTLCLVNAVQHWRRLAEAAVKLRQPHPEYPGELVAIEVQTRSLPWVVMPSVAFSVMIL